MPLINQLDLNKPEDLLTLGLMLMAIGAVGLTIWFLAVSVLGAGSIVRRIHKPRDRKRQRPR